MKVELFKLNKQVKNVNKDVCKQNNKASLSFNPTNTTIALHGCSTTFLGMIFKIVGINTIQCTVCYICRILCTVLPDIWFCNCRLMHVLAFDHVYFNFYATHATYTMWFLNRLFKEGVSYNVFFCMLHLWYICGCLENNFD